MAPRGRSRKVGLKRIDAAFDALIPLGFSKAVIEKTVKRLLKVYDGDVGWVFIEECSYKLLIETILEEQENVVEKDAKDDTCESGSREHEITESSAAECANEITAVGEASAVPDAMRLTTETGSKEDVSCRDASFVADELRLEPMDWVRAAMYDSGLVRRDCETVPRHVQPQNTPVIQWRKPCFGWISDDDGDEENEDTSTRLVVCQKPETMQIKKGPVAMKRKRRWDVKPEVT